jgi:hypothetical protein
LNRQLTPKVKGARDYVEPSVDSRIPPDAES